MQAWSQLRHLHLLILVVCCCIGLLNALQGSVKSTQGNLHFYPNQHGTATMTLNPTGLGIGTAPSTNLQVQGNAIITQKLNIGNSTTSGSNLYLSGTLAIYPQTVSSNALLNSSMVLADSSSANIYLALPDASLVEGRKVTIKKTSPHNQVHISGPIALRPHLSLTSGNTNALTLFAGQGNWHILSSLTSAEELFSTDNLQLWLDASQSSSFSYGGSGNIETWRDLSGKGRHFSQTSPSLQPTFNSLGFNAQFAGVEFSNGQFLEHASTSAFNFMHSGNGMTFFTVASFSQDLASCTLLDNGGSSTSRVGLTVRFHQNDFMTKITRGSANTNVFHALSSGDSTPPHTPTVSHIHHQYNASGLDYSYRINRLNTTGNESDLAPSGADAHNHMRMGLSHFNSEPMVGTISEIMAFDKVLSASEIERIHELLLVKYGL